MAEQNFQVGQVVVATTSYSGHLTEGKAASAVVGYEDEFRGLNYTWPANVIVIGDLGKPVAGIPTASVL